MNTKNNINDNNNLHFCNRCKKLLKSEKSIKRGYGPSCYKKALLGLNMKSLFYGIENKHN